MYVCSAIITHISVCVGVRVGSLKLYVDIAVVLEIFVVVVADDAVVVVVA